MTDVFAPSFPIEESLLTRTAKIRLVIFDVDGVLTDGRLIMGDDGLEYKAFNSKDGHGLKMLQQTGIQVAVITGRTSKVVEHRMADLGIDHLYQGYLDKVSAFQSLLGKLKLEPEQTAFIGDDVVDLPIMRQVGLAVTVQDGHHLVKHHAHWVTPSPGGGGAAREVCEMIMYANGTYAEAMKRYV